MKNFKKSYRVIWFIWSSWTGKSNLVIEIRIMVAKGDRRLEMGTKNLWGDGNILYIISGGGHTTVYVRAHWTQHLRPVHNLIICKLYLNKKNPLPLPKSHIGC